MSGSHSSQAHDHGAPGSFGRAFAFGIALNVGFVVIEAGYGFISGSLALLADAGHNLSDVLGLVIAWGAVVLGRKAPTERFTYGYRRSSILSALFNGVLLLAAAGAIALEAVQRFGHPQPVPGTTIMVVAAIGIAVNTATALLFVRGRRSDINIKGAFLHMAADAVVSAGVVIAGLGIVYTGATWIDPVTSLVIVAVIVWSTWGLLRDAITMSLDAVPAAIDLREVAAALRAMPGVLRVHDLHIWPMSTTETALTAHLVRPGVKDGVRGDGAGEGAGDDAFLCAAADMLHDRFGIEHATLQIECG